MRKNIYKSQIGSISMYVMMAMAFFLATIVGVYMISAKRSQTQTESLSIVRGKYYTEGEENERYSAKMPAFNEFIPIYTKEQLWSIGENKYVEIEGKVYEFNTTDLSKYELKNDIIINIETDLANSKFKDNFLYGDNTINKNNFEVFYYYNGNYYVPVQYSDGTTITNLSDGTAVLSASGNNFSNISTVTTGLSGKYYLFAYANLSGDLGYVTDGLMLHYDGIKNTATGHKSDATTWKDLSGNGRDGTLNGCAWKENNLSFDGVDDGVAIAEMNYETPTVEAVVQFNNLGTTEQCIVSNFESGGYGLTYLSQKSAFQIYTNSYYRANGNTLIENKIYSLSGRYDKINICLRENDNVYNKTISGTISAPANNTIMMIGANPSGNRPSGEYLNGKVYSARIYNRALTDSEVQQNYEIDKARFGIE